MGTMQQPEAHILSSSTQIDKHKDIKPPAGLPCIILKLEDSAMQQSRDLLLPDLLEVDWLVSWRNRQREGGESKPQ